jgi:hypothetical protein
VDVMVYPEIEIPAVAVSDALEIVNAGAAIAVAGNTAVMTPELALCVTDEALATVKKLAVTPLSV